MPPLPPPESPHPSRSTRALLDLLPSAADVQVEVQAGDETADLVVNGHPIEVKWASRGGLREARELLDRIGHRGNVVVVAAHLSPGARQVLSEAGVGWADESGAAEVSIGPVLISRTGRPEPRTVAVKAWTRGVLAVAEALLCGVKGTVAAVHEATGLSTGTSTNALRFLTEHGLLTADARRGRDSARRIADRRRLLDAYADAVAGARKPNSLQVGLQGRDMIAALARVGEAWEAAGVAWAATGAAAAAVLAPLLTSVSTADVFIDASTIAGLEKCAAQVGLRPIEGGRLTLRPFPTETARRLASTKQDLRVAPWPRVYADLRRSGVRGEEAAEHLFELADG